MSQVVIGDILPYTQATAILNQVLFNTNWTANTASDVVVYVTPVGDEPDDVTQILSYPSDYSVSFVGDSEQVTVTLVTPSADGDIVTITRQTPADRMNLYTNTNFIPSMLNNDFGILTLVDQQAQLADQKIAPRYNYSATIVNVVDTILPILAANETWVKNSGNTAFIPYSLPSSGIAPADATYVTITNETAELPNSVNFSALTNGIVSYNSGTGLFVTRSITGSANEITITNATGVSGNMNVGFPNNMVIPGTGSVGLPGGTTLQRVITAAGTPLRYNSEFDSLEYFSTGTWSLINDDTDGIIHPGLTDQIPYYAADGVVLTATSTLPLTVQTNITELGTITTGVWNGSPIPTANGGTGLASPTAHGILISEGASAFNPIVLTDGQLLIGSTGIDPVARTLTQGSGVTITNGSGTITISATGTGGTVTSVATGAGLTGGTITTTGTIALAAIADHTLLANISGGALAPSSTTLTALIDNAIGNTQGNILYRNASSWVVLAPGTSGQVLQTSGAAANPAYSTATYPTVAGSAGKVLISDGTNFVSSTPTFPTTAGTIGSIIISDGTNKINSTSLWPNTVGSAGKILRSDGTTNAYTTSTFADTYAINTLLYNASANTVSGLATANSGVLITSSGGVPSISSTLPSAVQTNITALGTQSQALNMGTHLINNVVDPVSAQDVATKNYVDQTALTGTSVYAASAASLGTVTQSGAGVGATLTNAGTQATFALDGVNPPVGSEVLIKNIATGMTAANEGIYVVTSVGSGASNWILTRDVDYDTPSEINETGLIIVRNGSTLAGTGWYNAATIVTVDTTPFSFSQFGSGGTVTSVATNNGLTGGTITSTGTIGLAAIAAHNLLANVTAGSAVPTAVPTSTFLQSIAMQTFTANGTYTPTANMVYCIIECIGSGGGGGGGAGVAATSTGAGGGGGGGEYTRSVKTAAQVSTSQAVTIGAAGAAGSSGTNNGGAGNTTSVGSLVTAAGGGGGNGSIARSTSEFGGGGGSGGTGGTGDFAVSGGSGGVGVVVSGSTGIAIVGKGGNSFYGMGSNGGGGSGGAGSLYGAGGSGGYAAGANTAGNAGAAGLVIITEFIAV